MSEKNPTHTAAIIHRSKWPGLIWAVPVAALLVVGWLGVRALAQRGVEVTMDVKAADGIKVQDTKVTYLGLEVGAVTGIALAPDPNLIRLTLRIDDKMASELRTGTVFWVVGNNVSLSDLSSIRASFAGPAIGMMPGPGTPARHFVAADRGPVLPPGTPGTHYRLIAADVESVDRGTSIYAEGLQVGSIVNVVPSGEKRFILDAFVRAPFDRQVHAASHFWDSSALQILGDAGGLEARLSSPKAALAGGVAFTTPPEAAGSPIAGAGTAFTLYTDAAMADSAPIGPEIPYEIAFDGAVGELKTGAPVKLRGFTVGRVHGIGFAFDAKRGLQTNVTVTLDPARLRVDPSRAAVDAMLGDLVRKGLRARLDQSPPLIGGRLVSLDFVKDAPPAKIEPGTPAPRLPATSSGDIGNVVAEADAILAKVNKIPIVQIGDNVRDITRDLERAIRQAGPKIAPMIDALHHAADSIQTTADAAGKTLGAGGARQDSDLPSAIRQLTEAARSIRGLADYLGRHPEAILTGKKADK